MEIVRNNHKRSKVRNVIEGEIQAFKTIQKSKVKKVI